MPPNFQSRMALPPAVRLIVERLEDIALNFIIPTEDQSWRVYTVTSADYAALFTYLRQTGNEELFDCMESLRYAPAACLPLLLLTPSLAMTG